MAEVINPAIVPKVTLPSGEQVPCVGMGTFGSDRVSAEDVSAAVAGAIRSGYRMFDCAACYGNEHEIGQVFKDAFDEGVVERKDLFIMTKVWNDMHRRVEEACDKSIKDLQCDYVDMYFIHWPFPNYHAPGCDVDSRNPDSKPFSVEEFMDTYRQGEALVEKGKIRYIGISNMTNRFSTQTGERYLPGGCCGSGGSGDAGDRKGTWCSSGSDRSEVGTSERRDLYSVLCAQLCKQPEMCHRGSPYRERNGNHCNPGKRQPSCKRTGISVAWCQGLA